MENSQYKGDVNYSIDCTGDACVGDEVAFERATFTGSFRNAKFDGFEMIRGTITKDSYGKDKQQHTFTIRSVEGWDLRIKGRNLYANGTYRKRWIDEEKRGLVLEDKHTRGNQARAARAERKLESIY